MKKILILLFVVSSLTLNGQVSNELYRQRLHHAMELLKRGEALMAQEEFSILILSHPSEQDLYLARAKARLALHQYDLAMTDYDTATRLGNNWQELDGRTGIMRKNFINGF